MTHLETEEKIILAGDMALHWGACLASTHVGVIASMHWDAAQHVKGAGARQVESLRVLLRWVAENVDYVDDVAYELPTPQSLTSALSQGKMIGVIEQAAYTLRASENFLTVRPNTLKKWAAGHGFAEKWQMVAAANEWAEYPAPIVDGNEGDAVCLAMWAVEQVQHRELRRLARQMQRETEGAKW
jgi:Holliday junction resolvasome RuvABC endonuclease subunit